MLIKLILIGSAICFVVAVIVAPLYNEPVIRMNHEAHTYGAKPREKMALDAEKA